MLICFGLAATACSSVLGPEKDDLSAARARWAVVGSTDYVFEFRRFCFCDPDTNRLKRIEVFGGVVSSAVYVDTSEPVVDLSAMPTVEDLFDEIQTAIDGDPHMLSATYDPDLGFPMTYSVDPIEFAVDEEMSFAVTAFQLVDTTAN